MPLVMADSGKLIEVVARTGSFYEIPAWGFLEAIEIRFTPPLPNMEAGNLNKLIIDVVSGTMGSASPQVFARVRDVKEEFMIASGRH